MIYVDVPAKVLECFVISQTGEGAWPFDDQTNDPFWRFGSSPRDYQWTITISVKPQSHSSHKTRQPYQYNGMDVRVGDYIASTRDGMALKIIRIDSKRDEEIVCLVEDFFRYNQFRDVSGYGNGIFDIPSEAVIFSINDSRLPVVDPLPPSGVGLSFYPNLMSRFQNLESLSNLIIEKPNHGFRIGQVVSADQDQNGFVLADNDHPFVIGTIVFINGPDHFTVNPIQKVIEHLDNLPGSVGDILYTDDIRSGQLTLNEGLRPVMIKLRDATPSICRSTIRNASSSGIMMINGSVIHPTGHSSTAWVNAINAAPGDLVARLVPIRTDAETNSGRVSSRYGEVLANMSSPGLSAKINGVAIVFHLGRYGIYRYSDASLLTAEDIAEQINQRRIAGINATVEGGYLRVHNLLGGGITIENLSPDTNQTPFAGPNSITGLALVTVTQPGSLIEITAPDARSIDLTDVVGDPIGDFGFYSVENGNKAAALYIEQGIRTASNYVVPDIAGRDALETIIGDQAYVIDKGDQQWGLYLFTGGSWSMISTAEAAKVDSDTCFVTINYQSSSGTIAKINGGSKVTSITVEVLSPFDTMPILTIGTTAQPNLLMGNAEIDLKTVGTYVAQPSHVFDTGSEVQIGYFLQADAALSGQARITVTYQ